MCQLECAKQQDIVRYCSSVELGKEDTARVKVLI